MSPISIRLEIVGPVRTSDAPDHGKVHVIQVGIKRGEEIDSGKLIAKTESMSEALDQVVTFLKGFLNQRVDLKNNGEIILGRIKLPPSRRPAPEPPKE